MKRVSMFVSAACFVALGMPASVLAQGSKGGRSYSDLEIQENFQVTRWSIQDLELDTQAGEDLTFNIELAGTTYIIGLLNDPVRSPRFEVLIVDDTGTHRAEEGDLPPSTTFKGDVVDPATGFSVGRAGGSAFEGQFSGCMWIERDDGTRETFWIQPLTDGLKDAPRAAHIVYAAEDVIPGNGICGTDLLPGGGRRGGVDEKDLSGGGERNAGDKVFEISIDCDFEYFVYNGRNFKATLRDAEKIVANCEVIYERDVDISWEISLMIVRRTSASDPYTSTDASTLLDQFHDYWCANYPQVDRDTAHLFTGNSISGGTIGIAYVGVICDGDDCSGLGYALSWQTWTNSLPQRVGLCCHEVGHNWNASHCDGAGDCSIMCSVLGGCSGNISKFGRGEQRDIENHRDTRSCLTDDVDPIFLPFFDDFPTTTIDVLNWSWNRRSNISAQASNEPSAPNSLRFNAVDGLDYSDDQIRTNEIDMTGAGTVNLSYFLEWRQTEGTETLNVQGYTVSRSWLDLLVHAADATTQNSFTFFSVDLDPNMVHSAARIRFKPDVEEAADYFFVDDVSIVDMGFLRPGHDPGPVSAGDWFDVHAIGPRPGTPVSLFLGLGGARIDPAQIKGKKHLELQGQVVPIGTVIADAQGVGNFEFQIPSGLPPGKLHLQAVIWDSRFTRGFEVTTFEVIEVKP